MANNYQIYFAQPVDDIDRKSIVDHVQKVKDLLKDLPIEVVAPYIDETMHNLPIDEEGAKYLVGKDASFLDKCDILLADLSKENRQAVGIYFEMAYFWFVKKKEIIVYVGSTSIAERVWIKGTTKKICKSWKEVRDAVEDCIS
ncbi:MAG: nucleoside 2-deoxyribosyltransferase [Anaerolineales bacterium]|jgi:nucleoside 2-deoxyribosyltransferase